MPLTTPRILTAWDTVDGDIDDEDEGMGLWMMANDFTGRWGGNVMPAVCHVCDGKLVDQTATWP